MEAFGGLLTFGKDEKTTGYFRVAGNIVSAHAGEKFAAESFYSLTGARVVLKRGKKLQVDLRDGNRLKFSADSDVEAKAWLRRFKMASTRTFRDSYALGDQIAEGGFGTVYAATSRCTGIDVAVKYVEKPRYLTKARSHVENEVKALMSVFHRNVHRIYEIFDDGKAYLIVMERVAGGTLEELMLREKYLDEVTASRIAWDILSALRHIHGMRIIHRDIKAENILLVNKDPRAVPFGEPLVKICDFGLCSLHRPVRFDDIQIDSLECDTFVGSFHYLSPEQARREVYGPAVDIWACGINIYYMLRGTYPLPIQETTYSVDILKLLKDAHVQFDAAWRKDVSLQCRKLAEAMLHEDPQMRPSAVLSQKALWFTEQNVFSLQESFLRALIKPKPTSPPKLDGLVFDGSRIAEPFRVMTQSFSKATHMTGLRSRLWTSLHPIPDGNACDGFLRRPDVDQSVEMDKMSLLRHSVGLRGKGSGRIMRSARREQPLEARSRTIEKKNLIWNPLNASGLGGRRVDPLAILEEGATPWESHFIETEEDRTMLAKPVEYFLPEEMPQKLNLFLNPPQSMISFDGDSLPTTPNRMTPQSSADYSYPDTKKFKAEGSGSKLHSGKQTILSDLSSWSEAS
eukprot:Plantae.Rhodophyta-Purpureofilum_apyrenoidigerum.ctg9873.p1 GENE.Plantae.Rhodophyta-Purpureofilum_apyrenoidigerum.ctg9873~~Plantae.Rhodophyta-Purpureofilum_apyrenoidigerum.ctg9873.p1  ORF type:complete len:628 (+),score=101.33 Plantae.Rhodophyta-Purpureofilum_apyrenoidigerum.ctg9873:350-2233(+)